MERNTDRVLGKARQAREGADANLPRGSASAHNCPKCGSTKFQVLASSDSYQRYECSNLDCMETFAVPIAGARIAQKEEEEANPMAKVKKSLRCSKCNKEFAHEAWLMKHTEKCTGEAAVTQVKRRKPTPRADHDGSVEEDPDLPGTQPKRKGAPAIGIAEPEEYTVPIAPRNIYVGTRPSRRGEVLADLVMKLDQARRDVVELKALIDAVEAVEVDPVPFAGSRIPKESA